MLRLSSHYGPERLEAACRRALTAGLHSYKGVKNILDAHLDAVTVEETPAEAPAAHANIRGPDYYR